MKINIEESSYTKNSFLEWISLKQDDDLSSWLKELHSFAQEWFAEKESISVHTSGSTGTPKWIKHSRSSVERSAELTIDYFNLKENDRILHCLPSRFIAGKLMLVRAFVGNLDLTIVEPSSNPFENLDTDFEFIAVTPHQLSIAFEKSPEKIQRVKKILIGGGPISNKLHGKIKTLKSHCYHSYGMTETITHIAIKVLNGPNASNIYQAIKGVHFQVDKEQALIIKARHLDSSPLITNDIVKLHSDQSFEWLGRKDHVINSGGIKLNPEQIEQKITSIITTPFLIASEKNDTFGEQLILLVEGDNYVIKDLEDKLSNHLTGIEIPKAVYTVKHFARTENGKLKRKEILRRFFKTKQQ